MMDFVTNFWRFDGRLSRLAYAWRCVATVVVFVALLVLGAEAFGLTPAEVPGPLFFVEPIPNAILTLLFYWAVMALSAQRLRDMGFPVLPIIAALIGLELLENFVLPRLTNARLPDPLDMATPVGGILLIVAYLWLLVWPSATDPAPSSDPPDPSRRNGASLPPPA
ncbi:DUF805 domain-containing protein [Bosea vestrisii]|uniref:DUF805 domain-containing protein n=1 Tax=Bosea vestrisii TaxID=151416 RepID=UPI0024DF58D1|nr:DUF805 domain-containing protein [Bosea vestrisii]WID97515.1 DUF805 domain-containing protein [Bosea vestrisii]